MNRIDADLNQWHTREERFGKLFSFSLSSNNALAKEKLAYYDRIAAKYSGTKDPDERLTLKMLRYERNHLEKKLYPNLLLRMLRRILINPVKQQVIVRQDNRKTAENSQALHLQVQRAGFPDLAAKIDQQIRLGQQQFSLPVSYYLNGKERIDHQLSFTKGQSGLYQFDGYKTTLYNEAKPDEKRQQYFSANDGQGVHANEAYNLLSGRCVQRDGAWIQLDLNDTDAQGNFRVKHFHHDYGYQIEKELRQLPLKELQHDADRQQLEAALKKGDRVSVSFIKDGKEQKFYIEANPQFKSINIYDEHTRKVSLQSALGNKVVEGVKHAFKINKKQDVKIAKQKSMRLK